MRNDMLKAWWIVVATSLVLPPPSAFSQTPAASVPVAVPAAAADFNPEQLDALLAPVALYPDTLLVQVLMASTFPLQVVSASRWLAEGANKSLTGDALAAAVEQQSWDPSVMSLVPFPQVLAMMNDKLDWTQQLGYVFATQQADVMDSVQRLRLQAQAAGNLKTNEQQSVQLVAVMDDQGAPTGQQTVVIQPANPQVVYVPTYNPTVVYGAWPYPLYPPVYFPPPPGYAPATAFVSGMAFMAGVAVVGSLWGWATPHWGYGGYNAYRHYGNVNVNVSHYNNISRNTVNRTSFSGNTWRPAAPGVGERPVRPPGGPVGAPVRPGNGLPANAIGRPAVKVPASAVNRPTIGKGGNQVNVGQVNIGSGNNANRTNVGGNRTNVGNGASANRPAAGTSTNRPNTGATLPSTGANRPSSGGNAGKTRPAAPAQRPATPARGSTAAPKNAISGVGDGKRAGQAQSRGAQSRRIDQPRPVGTSGNRR